MDSGIPIDVTFKPTLKCGQLESATFVTNKDNTKEGSDDIPVEDTTTDKSNDNNIKVDKGATLDTNDNPAETTINEATKDNTVTIPVKNNMYHLRASPQYVHEINSKSKMVNDLLKRAISNAYRHDLNLRPGHLNNADGNCLWEAIIYNMLYRECFRRKSKETSKQLRKRSLDQAQLDSQTKLLPFMESNTTEADWDHIRQDKIYETKLGDICIIAAAGAIKKDMMIFNKNFALAPITLICAKEYSGGELGDTNPILMAYNGTHYESLETITPRDDNRAKEIVQLICMY